MTHMPMQTCHHDEGRSLTEYCIAQNYRTTVLGTWNIPQVILAIISRDVYMANYLGPNPKPLIEVDVPGLEPVGYLAGFGT